MAGVTEVTTVVTDLVTGNSTLNNDTTTTTSTTSTTTTPELTTSALDVSTKNPASVAVRASSAFVLSALCAASFIFNLITVIVLLRKWNNSANYLLVNITVADLIMTFLWGIPAIVVAANWEWNFGDKFCTFHEFIGTWCHVVIIHTLVAVAVEKLILFWRPSKHKEVFYRTVVLVLIAGIWLFDVVIALFPVMNWGEVWYSPYQFQCAEDYKVSYSLLNFNFVVIYLVPAIAIVVLYSLVMHRVRTIRCKVVPGKQGKVILEEDKNASHETYGQKYAKQQRKYKTLGRPSKRSIAEHDVETEGNKRNQDLDGKQNGYEINSQSDVENSRDEGPEDYESLYQKKTAAMKKRIYLFKEHEFRFAITMLFATIAYLSCWFPILVLSYYWAYNFENPPTDEIIAVFSCLTFLGLSVKPIIYISNKEVRISVLQALKKSDADT